VKNGSYFLCCEGNHRLRQKYTEQCETGPEKRAPFLTSVIQLFPLSKMVLRVPHPFPWCQSVWNDLYYNYPNFMVSVQFEYGWLARKRMNSEGW